MNRRMVGLIVAFVAGQAIQLVMQGMVISLNMWDNRRILFCLAGGVVILVAILAGVYISREREEYVEAKKSYQDYVKIPESEEPVIDPFKIVEEVRGEG